MAAASVTHTIPMGPVKLLKDWGGASNAELAAALHTTMEQDDNAVIHLSFLVTFTDKSGTLIWQTRDPKDAAMLPELSDHELLLYAVAINHLYAEGIHAGHPMQELALRQGFAKGELMSLNFKTHGAEIREYLKKRQMIKILADDNNYYEYGEGWCESGRVPEWHTKIIKQLTGIEN